MEREKKRIGLALGFARKQTHLLLSCPGDNSPGKILFGIPTGLLGWSWSLARPVGIPRGEAATTSVAPPQSPLVWHRKALQKKE